MNLRSLAAALLVLPLVASQAHAQPKDAAKKKGGPVSIPFSKIYESPTSDLDGRSLSVLDTDIGFMGFMAGRGVDPIPDFDYRKNVAVAICPGKEPTGGFSVSVTGVSMIDSKITVSYVVNAPAKDAKVAAAATCPLVVVQFAKQEGVPTSITHINFHDVTPGAEKPPTPFAGEPKLPKVVVIGTVTTHEEPAKQPSKTVGLAGKLGGDKP